MKVVRNEVSGESAVPHRHLFTVEEYHRLGRASVIAEDARIELIEGELLETAPIGSQHAGWVGRLTRLLVQRTPDNVTVYVQNPVRLGEHSELQPDLALLRPRELPYTEAHPGPEDVLLLVEVADSSLTYDRERKVTLYGRHSIPEVWLFDLLGGQLDIYLDPFEDGYRRLFRPGPDERIAPLLLPETVMDLKEFYGLE
jgi:Uma2 family endonuclease